MALGLADSELVSSINVAEAEGGGGAGGAGTPRFRINQSLKKKPANLNLQMKFSSFQNLAPERMSFEFSDKVDATRVRSHQPTSLIPPLARPASELEAAATELQKAYRSYRTRRKLADCAVIVEEFWWRDIDCRALTEGSFFDPHKSETPVSRWARASTMAAKLGKGLCKDEKAQKLALRHWLEVIDPRHRYGHNLHLYYNVWFSSGSCQPFFYWLDVGDGKEVNLQECPRMELQHQCIKYLGPKEREAYEVIVESGKLVYMQSKVAVETLEGEKWIFVLSASRTMYVGKKHKAFFHHSSFLAGGAAIAAGRLVAHDGVLEAIWAYSGHYRPTEESFSWFLSFLEKQGVDLTTVEKRPMDDDIPPTKVIKENINEVDPQHPTGTRTKDKDCFTRNTLAVTSTTFNRDTPSLTTATAMTNKDNALPRKWATGAGPRIGCVREYPPELLLRALEQVNLSPRTRIGGSAKSNGPIPSPRPSSKIHLSPRLAWLGLPSPRVHVSSNAKQIPKV
ncbi:hypothetical protein K2173_024696 [Erythroxylum novogranatense]|uniref:Uncharacterized protein n=1 Tax=Erythroxylum novogranatense TaxID=1862640 RepID=A0AAV8SWC1_9ROSI|nr:hypothetical protein K2173_024696 [Erythroxylum novogranatense]